MDSMSIERINIKVGSKRYGTRVRCIGLDLKGSSRGHDGRVTVDRLCDQFR